jgi:hypothetical protein
MMRRQVASALRLMATALRPMATALRPMGLRLVAVAPRPPPPA